MEIIIKYFPMVIAILALLVSGLNYYFSQHHDPKKLFLVPVYTIDTLRKKEICFYLINGGKSDMVVLSSLLSMNSIKPKGRYRTDDHFVSKKSDDFSIPGGEALEFKAHFPEYYSDTDIHSCGQSRMNSVWVDYTLSVKWCNSCGEMHHAEIDFFSAALTNDNRVDSVSLDVNKTVNLYKV